MIFWIEAVVLCLIFHALIAIVLGKKQNAFVNDDPPFETVESMACFTGKNKERFYGRAIRP